MNSEENLRLDKDGQHWHLTGVAATDFVEVNAYLGYLADRNYSVHTVRAYGFDLLDFCRWLATEHLAITSAVTDDLLRYLGFCRSRVVPNRPGPNVVSMRGQPLDRYAATTINRRLAAIAGLFAFLMMRDPTLVNPVPKGRDANRVVTLQRTGLLGHLARPAVRSPLRLREPRRLPRALNPHETTQLLGSLRSWRDRAIAGLMLYCGLRASEVLQLQVTDVDIGGRWLMVQGKGAKERRVPLDTDVAGVIQTYLLAERPETTATLLFVVGKGPTRGQPLTAAGLRTIFRYHREIADVPAAHPHALRHTFGTALAQAGVDLAVMRELLGHSHVDTTARYIHLAPEHVKAEYDAALARTRADH